MTRSDIDLPDVMVASVSRVAVRYPESGYLDLLARLATSGRMTSPEVLAWARAEHLDGDGTGDPSSLDFVKPHNLAGFALAVAALIDTDVQGQNGRLEDVARLLELAYWAGPRPGLAAQHRDLWLDALFLTGSTQRYPYVRKDAIQSRNWRVTVDEMNPYLSGSSPDASEFRFLAELSRVFTESGLSALHLPDGSAEPLHRIGALTEKASCEGPLVSVVIPAFNPEVGPPFSVTSIVRQSWTNLEVLICDDGSGPRGAEILRQWADVDSRVRVIRSEHNGGAYAAMNVGLAHARGEFVTFQGSDDWSHPQRIERQVGAVRDQPEAMGTLSHMVRVDDRLALTVMGYSAAGVNASSLLFRRTPVLQRLGGMDSVRRAGDNEFVGRIRAVFGADAVPVLPEILALVRRTPGSLSRSDMRLLFRHPARAHYRSGYRRWHEHIAAEGSSGWVPPPQRAPIPALSRISGVPDAAPEHLDVAVCGSMARNAPSAPDVAAEVIALAGTGAQVGIADFPGPLDLSVIPRGPAGALLDLVTSGSLAWLLPDERWSADLAIIKDPAAVTYLGDSLNQATVKTVLLVADYSFTDRYDPAEVEVVVARSCGALVRWLPATGFIADALRHHVDPIAVLAPRLWGVAPAASGDWARAPQLLVGVIAPPAGLSAAAVTRWEERHVPQAPHTQVWSRVSADSSPVRSRLKRDVTSIERRHMSEGEFLSAVSYLVVPPTPGRGAHLDPRIIRGLTRGCVVLADPAYRDHFGDALLYTDDLSPDEWIETHAVQPDLYRLQQDRAQHFLNTRLSSHAMRATLDSALVATRHVAVGETP